MLDSVKNRRARGLEASPANARCTIGTTSRPRRYAAMAECQLPRNAHPDGLPAWRSTRRSRARHSPSPYQAAKSRGSRTTSRWNPAQASGKRPSPRADHAALATELVGPESVGQNRHLLAELARPESPPHQRLGAEHAEQCVARLS